MIGIRIVTLLLLEAVRIFDLNGDELDWDKDHTWMQEAWTIRDVKGIRKGDRVSCIATVTTYRSKQGTQIGFTDPITIEWQPIA